MPQWHDFMLDWAVRGENYFKASIEAGRVGADQAPSNVEFGWRATGDDGHELNEQCQHGAVAPP